MLALLPPNGEKAENTCNPVKTAALGTLGKGQLNVHFLLSVVEALFFKTFNICFTPGKVYLLYLFKST